MERNRDILAAPSRRVYPAPGTHLARILTDAPYRREFHTRLKRFNPLVVALYRAGLLPLLGAARTVMLLTTRGRKSGRLRTTPVGYFRIGGTVTLFSAWGRAASWYQNLAANPRDVWIQIGLHRRPARAEVLAGPDEIQRVLAQLIAESPQAAGSVLGWNAEQDQLEQADFSAFTQSVLVVRFVEG